RPGPGRLLTPVGAARHSRNLKPRAPLLLIERISQLATERFCLRRSAVTPRLSPVPSRAQHPLPPNKAHQPKGNHPREQRHPRNRAIKQQLIDRGNRFEPLARMSRHHPFPPPQNQSQFGQDRGNAANPAAADSQTRESFPRTSASQSTEAPHSTPGRAR